MNKNTFTNILVVSFFIFICAGIVGIGVYVWQDSVSRAKEEQLQKQITELEKTNDELQQTLNELNQRYCKGTWENGECLLLTCGDSDADKKPDDIYVKGIVTFTDENGVDATLYDECNGSNTQLIEKYCYESPEGTGNFTTGALVYDCPLGCFDGACNK